MKIVLCLFAISVCFADISPKNESLYRKVWEDKNEKSIEICLSVVDDPSTPNVDKLHFLKTLLILRNEPNDRIKIDELIKKDPDCWHDNELYYN